MTSIRSTPTIGRKSSSFSIGGRCEICYEENGDGCSPMCNHLCQRCISRCDGERCIFCGKRGYRWYLEDTNTQKEIPIRDVDNIENILTFPKSDAYIDGLRYQLTLESTQRIIFVTRDNIRYILKKS